MSRPRVIRRQGVALTVAPAEPSAAFEAGWWALFGDLWLTHAERPAGPGEPPKGGTDDDPIAPQT